MSRIAERLHTIQHSVAAVQDTDLFHLQFPSLPQWGYSKDFHDIMRKLGKQSRLEYIKSGSTGHTFRVKTSSGYYAVKLTAYTKREQYGGVCDEARPENAELRMLNLLSEFVKTKVSPHIVLPVSTFHTSLQPFILPISESQSKKYKLFMKRCNKKEFYDTATVLISEWVNGGDLLDFLRRNYKKLELKHWKVIVFQIIFTLAVIQKKYPGFRHNDLKANNILVEITKRPKTPQYYEYQYEDKRFQVPDIGIQTRLWDFDFSCIPGVIENQKVDASWTNKINVKPEPNRYYDVHYFFCTLLGFFPDLEEVIPYELQHFYSKVLPEKFRTEPFCLNKQRRLIKNSIKIGGIFYEYPNEYCYPEKLLEDDLFSEFVVSS
jgi:serine/threonine protein kinase